MSFYSKIRGTFEALFQLGGTTGPQLKANSGSIEARNAGDSAFAILRTAAPVANNDAATKLYVDTISKPFVITAQFDGNNVLPANTSTAHFTAVTTTGSNATIGQILYDDGSATGTATILTALEGRTIFTSQAFAGGTVTFNANSFYVWDTVSTSWLQESSPAALGAVRVVHHPLTNANGSQDSAAVIPSNALIVRARLVIVTPYSGGATIALGQAGATTLLMLTTDNTPQLANVYENPQSTSWGGSALAVRATIAGAPAAGAGFFTIEYTTPDA